MISEKDRAIRALSYAILQTQGRRAAAARRSAEPTRRRSSIKANRAKCAKCGDVIESKHVHDFVSCKCGAISVDGGRDYLRRVGSPANFIELSEREPDTDAEQAPPLKPPPIVELAPAQPPLLKLWIDDEREPPDDGWIIARTADDAIAQMKLRRFDVVSLDHDLGHCDKCKTCKGYLSACGCRCHLTGSYIVNWMVTENRWPRFRPMVHSRNPVGAEYMRSTIDRYGPYANATHLD